MTADYKILLTGATGYIGGSVLASLLSGPHPVKPSQITVLIRGSESRAAAFREYGVSVVFFGGLDDSDAMQEAASQHDLVIGTTLGYHTGSAVAIIKGLAARRAAGRPCLGYLHTDGTSNIGDHPISHRYDEPRYAPGTATAASGPSAPGTIGDGTEFSDVEDNMCEYMRMRQGLDVYIQRTTSLAVIDEGTRLGVPTFTMMAPTIYGVGSGAGLGEDGQVATGSFDFGSNSLSVMIPMMMRDALTRGQASVIGPGIGVRDAVHVRDLADLYALLAHRIMTAQDLVSGARGIFFASASRYTWLQAAQGIADAGFAKGVLRTREVDRIGLEEAAARWNGEVDGEFTDDAYLAELGLVSNAKSRPDHAHTWGWKPTRGDDSFKKHFAIELDVILRMTEKEKATNTK